MIELKVIIIIPSFNRIRYTSKILEIIYRQNFTNLLIILTDSGSKDGTQLLAKKYNNVILIENSQDTWWAGAVSKACEYIMVNNIKYNYLVVLNDDVEFKDDMIKNLIDISLKNADEFILCPAQISTNGEYYGTNYSNTLRIPVLNSKKMNLEFEIVDVVNGCLMLIPEKIVKILPNFNEFGIEHAGADFAYQLYAAKKNVGVLCIYNQILNQVDATEYLTNFQIRDIFKSNKSIVNIKTYLNFGKVLFGGYTKFIIFGVYHHVRYSYYIIKILYFKLFLINNAKK